MKCKICHQDKFDIVYNGFLRSGSFGKTTKEKYNVFHCKNCEINFIDNVLENDYYNSKTYRLDYNNSLNVADFYKEYDAIDTSKIAKIGLQNLRNKVVADFGTAAGTFLAAICNIAKTTIAIEPSLHFHENLQKSNKYVFSYGKNLVENGIKIDVATSFDVIEHVSEPIIYLKEIYDSLNEDGILYLKTPNFNDILQKLLPDIFEAFNYRTAHLFYFNENSMKIALEKSGFIDFNISFTHDLDMSNLALWLRDKKPTGLNKLEIFDEEFNSFYKKYTERKGLASHIWVMARKIDKANVKGGGSIIALSFTLRIVFENQTRTNLEK